jgi:uncharacterized phage protein (TIGR01671 family)
LRPIKFRAWDRKAKAMFPVHDMKFGKINNVLDHIAGVDIHHQDSDYSGDIWYGGNISKMTGTPLQPRFELMQFTGLVDRNGKEIYEGDVIQTITKGDIYQDVVKWNGEYGSWMFESTQGLCNVRWEDIGDNPEVIGNIHENTELLEAANAE